MTTAKAGHDRQPTEPLWPVQPDERQQTRPLPSLMKDLGTRPTDTTTRVDHPSVPEAPEPRRLINTPLWAALSAGAAWVAAIAIIAGSFALVWWLVQPQLGKAYIYDEAAFAFAGHAVAQTGLPFSNVGHMPTEIPGDFSKRFNWALWHPPLYVYLLGFAYHQWGETETVGRSVGIACNAIAALLIFATALLVLGGRSRAAPVYAGVGTALYVTNPFVMQSALLLDIDGTVLTASIALLALIYVLVMRCTRPLASGGAWFLLVLAAVSLGVSLWAKITTSLVLVPAATLGRLVATRPWQPWRLAIDTPVIAFGGGVLFVASWWVVCLVTKMPFALPFQILASELHDAAGSSQGWRENPRLLLDMISHVALWTSPYLILLFLWAGLARLSDLFIRPFVRLGHRLLRGPSDGEPWGARPIDFILLAGGTILLAYLIKLSASFPKYHISMMPLWAVAMAYLLSRYVPRLSWWEVPVYAVVLAGMAGYFVSFVGDQHVLFRGYDFVAPLLIWPAALGFAFLVLGAALGKYHLPRQLAILGVLLTLAWSWGVNLAQAQATYSTAYNYGTAGQRETAAYLNSILRPGEPYVAPRDVAYYARNQQYVDQDSFWAHLSQLGEQGITTFDGRIAGYPRVNVLALFLWDPNLGKIIHSYIDDRYDASFQSGPFVVFVRTGP